MYERFTDRARKVMQLANQEAHRLHHEYIGTEHILLALVKEGSGVAANVLKNFDINLEKIREEVEKLVQLSPLTGTPGKLPQTPLAKKVIEYTIEEARKLNHVYVGTEHILLGLLREQSGIAVQALVNLGLRLEDVREEVLNLLGPHLEPDEFSSSRAAVSKELPEMTNPRTPVLDSFGRDLTVVACNGKLEQLIGRTREIEKILVILSGLSRPCLLLVGEVGIGKRAIVAGLATRIAGGGVPAGFPIDRVVSLDLDSLLLGSEGWRQAGERLRAGLNEAWRTHTAVCLGALPLLFADWATGIAGLLQAVLRQTPPPLIAPITRREYLDHIAPNADLASLFEPIFVEPLSKEETLEVLREQKARYEERHRVTIAEEALDAAIEQADCVLEGCLPGKALRMLDWAAGLVHLRTTIRPPDLKEVDVQIEQLQLGKEAAIGGQDFDRAARLRDESDQLKKHRERLVAMWEQKSRESRGVVDAESVADAAVRMSEKQEPF